MLKYAMYGTSKEHTSLSLYCALAFYVNQPKSILSVKCNLTFRLWCGSYVKQECVCCFFSIHLYLRMYESKCVQYIYLLFNIRIMPDCTYIYQNMALYIEVCVSCLC